MCELERADATALLATGWRYPERFAAKGRDGKTDIYGVIYRPTNFDPAKRYPVVEDIYAGPQAAFVPKWRSRRRTYGMTGGRAGLHRRSDRRHGHQPAEQGHFMMCAGATWATPASPTASSLDQAPRPSRPPGDGPDPSGVGIYGTSAGGQDALRALEAHGDFYTAAVADCGCHDNRMDKIWWNELWMGWPLGPVVRPAVAT